MANQWVRLWLDMPNDPKWRTIARASGQSIGNVIAVYVHMLICAANATERGRTQSYTDEDTASALDLEIAQVTAIREAMQGRVLDGDYLRGWDKRQPLREDETAAERARAWREKRKHEQAGNADQTQANANERKRTTDKDTDTDTDKEKTKTKTSARAALAAAGVDEQTADDWIAHRKAKRATASATVIQARITECAKAGVSLADGLRLEVSRGWQGLQADWISNALADKPASPAPPYQSQQDKARAWAEIATGAKQDDRRIIDITPTGFIAGTRD